MARVYCILRFLFIEFDVYLLRVTVILIRGRAIYVGNYTQCFLTCQVLRREFYFTHNMLSDSRWDRLHLMCYVKRLAFRLLHVMFEYDFRLQLTCYVEYLVRSRRSASHSSCVVLNCSSVPPLS